MVVAMADAPIREYQLGPLDVLQDLLDLRGFCLVESHGLSSLEKCHERNDGIET